MAVATKKKAASGRSRPAVLPGALQTAAAFPALEAIFTRRARRFALGAELTGPLAYRPTKDPVPLAYEEEAILVAAATGVTGVVREEWPFTTAEGGPTGADKLASFTGRTFPSPLAIHGTELFWTNDDGVFVLPQRDVQPGALRPAPDARRSSTSSTGARSSCRTGGSTSRAAARTSSSSTSGS